MAVIFDEQPTYSILGDGRLIATDTWQQPPDGELYVGGKIFYIDTTASGAEYTFYTRTGKIIPTSDIQVGDEPYAYKVTGTPDKDKYYVFNANAVTSKTWTYKNDGGNWVYNLLGTADGIGKGKTNTTLVMTADSGAYVNYSNTIWNSLKALNDNADKGCSDWFVPSKAELEALRIATDREGDPLTTLFTNNYIWSSFETSNDGAWTWRHSHQNWLNNFKDNGLVLVCARGF